MSVMSPDVRGLSDKSYMPRKWMDVGLSPTRGSYITKTTALGELCCSIFLLCCFALSFPRMIEVINDTVCDMYIIMVYPCMMDNKGILISLACTKIDFVAKWVRVSRAT